MRIVNTLLAHFKHEYNYADIQSCVRLFADDTSLYIIVENPISAAEMINTDLETIHRWAEKWLVKFNPFKSESLLVSRKK